MAAITALRAREVYDSRGRPTVEAEVAVDGSWIARASVPSGISTGAHEAYERRDEPGSGPTRVLGAVRAVEAEIADAVKGLDPREQRTIDDAMIDLDGTQQKRRLGANAVLATSVAVCRAAAHVEGAAVFDWIARLAGCTPRIPRPIVNMISGGLHGGGNADLQDWLLSPRLEASYSDVLRAIVQVYWELGRTLVDRGYGRAVGDEGGYAPVLASNDAAFELIEEAALRAGFPMGKAFGFALDVAATHLFDGGTYRIRERSESLDSAALIELLTTWASRYPIDAVEDPVAEDDWEGWRQASDALGHLQLIGDDLFATQIERLDRAVKERIANTALVKMNQIGTLTETLDFAVRARASGYGIVVSARSGETEDAFLADLAVGLGADTIKVGSVARSERLAKYNRLLRIEEQLTRATRNDPTTSRRASSADVA